MIKLSTRTFGKIAKKEVLEHLGQPYRAIKAHRNLYKLVDRNGTHIGHVNVASGCEDSATLYIK